MNALNTHRSGARLLRLLVTGLAVLLLGTLTALPVRAASGTWTLTGSLNVTQISHTMTLLSNGQVLVAGGEDGNGTTIATAELYDPATGTWTLTGSLNQARESAAATLLQNGQVLVAGGLYIDMFGFSHALASAELYNPATGTWTLTGSMNTARDHPTATLLQNGQVLVANATSAELYDPATGTWTTTGSLNQARSAFTMTRLQNGQVLVTGGVWGPVLASAELYDPATGTWTATGSLNQARAFHTATLLPNGQVLVVGGATSGSSSTELYNPATGTWTLTGSLNQARSSHTATLLTGGQVLVAGGLSNSGVRRARRVEHRLPKPLVRIRLEVHEAW